MSTVTYDSPFTYDSPLNFVRPATVRATTASTAASTAATVTRLRLTRRGRAVIAALVSLPLVIALVALALNGGGATATTGASPVAVVTVESGETLWGLAAELAPEQPTADVVAQLIAMNELTSAELHAGQPIVVPAHFLD